MNNNTADKKKYAEEFARREAKEGMEAAYIKARVHEAEAAALFKANVGTATINHTGLRYQKLPPTTPPCESLVARCDPVQPLSNLYQLCVESC